MTYYKIGFLLLYFAVSSFAEFVSWPNVVRTYRGEAATLKWNISNPVSSDSLQIEFWYEKPQNELICSWNATNSSVHYGLRYNISNSKPNIKLGSNVISLSLLHVQPDDTLYSYKCVIRRGSQISNNSMAWIILYDTPVKPVITSSSDRILLHSNVSLLCYAKSTTTFPKTIPPELRPTTDIAYVWKRDNVAVDNDAKHAISDSGNSKLTIIDIQEEDNNKIYTCVAQEKGSKLSSSTDKRLTVLFKPGDAKAVTPSVGPYFEGHRSPVKLVCQVSKEGSPPAKFRWTKNGVVHGVTNGGTYTIQSGKLSLQLHNGLWQCTPFNDVGSGQPASIEVTVYSGPVFVANLSDQTVTLDSPSDLDVLCTVKGKPNPTVMWKYESDHLPDGVVIETVPAVRSTHNLTTVSKRLTWSANSSLAERRASVGVYECTGVVRNRTIKKDINIKIKYKPGVARATIKKFGPYFEHHPMDIRLTCSVNDTGSPVAKFEWSRQGIPAGHTDSNFYVIPKGNLTAEQHDGHWQCTPYNMVGKGKPDSFDVLVYVKPKIIAMPSHTAAKADVRTDLDVLCRVNGRPTPTVKWEYNGGSLPAAVSVVTEPNVQHGKTVTVNSRLVWSNASSVDDRRKTGGVYSCIGKVEDQETRHNVRIDVQYGPYDIKVMPPGENISRVENEDLKLMCSAICNPNCTYLWKRKGHVVSLHSELEFASIDRTDGGTYICTATNGPSLNAKVHIEVLSPPFEPEGFHVTLLKPHYIVVEWTPGYNGGFDQSFVVKSTDVGTGIITETPLIPEAVNDSGHAMVYNITEGIEPGKRYKIRIVATNAQGRTIGEAILVNTPALARFVGKPIIAIVKSHARIIFILSGWATRLKVENCAGETAICAVEDIVVPEKKRAPTDSSEVITEFSGSVDLADPEAKAFHFKFWIYDGAELINENPTVVIAKRTDGLIRILKFAALGAIVLFVIILIICTHRLRKRAKEKRKRRDSEKEQSSDDEADESSRLLQTEGSSTNKTSPTKNMEAGNAVPEKKVESTQPKTSAAAVSPAKPKVTQENETKSKELKSTSSDKNVKKTPKQVDKTPTAAASTDKQKVTEENETKPKELKKATSAKSVTKMPQKVDKSSTPDQSTRL